MKQSSNFFPSVHPKGQWTRISRFYWSSFPRLFIRQAYVEVIKVKRTEHIQIRRYICVLDRNVKLKPGSVQNLPCFCTPSLNDVFEIKNELKKLHINPFLHMPRYYKNAKKQIISWKKIIYTIKFCVLLPLVGKSAS